MKERSVARAGGLEVILIQSAEEISRFNELLEAEHYLGEAPSVGDFLRQVVVENGQWVALLVWGPAAYRLKDRDQWIGWDAGRRAERLKLIVQNRRFLVLGSARRPNLASGALGASIRILAKQWQERFGYAPVLAETFTDMEAYAGTCYKAAGWEPLGICEGHSRHRADYYVPNGRPKKLWIKPLHAQAQSLLCADRLAEAQQEGQVGAPTGQMPLSVEQMYSLAEALREVPDPRARNNRFQIHSVLALVAMALLSGKEQISEISRFANRLTAHQRAHLGLPRKENTEFWQVPGYSVFYQVLTRLEPEKFAEVLNRWIQTHRGGLPAALAMDGKSVRDRIMIVTLADEEGNPQGMAVCPGKGHEMLTARELIQKVPTLDGVVITADALHCQRETASAIVEKGGDYLLQIKDNQPSLLQLAQTQLSVASPLL